MAITNILEKFVDERRNGLCCKFNGYLEDYLHTITPQDNDYDLLNEIYKQNNDAKILTNYRFGINKDAITNQIIHYKDAFKLEEDAIIVPYIIYETKERAQRAMILYPYGNCSYLLAKGIYYCLTEPGGEFIDNRNEFLAVSLEDNQEVCKYYQLMFTEKLGALQRQLDATIYPTYNDMKEDILKECEHIQETIFEDLAATKNKLPLITNTVIKWFLFKKVLYVQYMLNKSFLANHDNNVHLQRNQAKLNADAVRFISLRQLWQSAKNG